MNTLALLGWTGNVLFFARFLVQWIASERARAVVVPIPFWWFSLTGSLALTAYAAGTGEPVLMLGAAINTFLYARNLRIARFGGATALRPVTKWSAFVVASLGAAIVVLRTADRVPDPHWVAASALGQAAWSARFVVQWVVAERTGRARLTPLFWWLSLAGSTLLLAYAIHLRDAVIIAGYALTPLLQIRNLLLPQPDEEPAGDARGVSAIG